MIYGSTGHFTRALDYPDNHVVGLELKHILIALVIAVIAYAIREVRRWRLSLRPKRPDLGMEEAWRHWLEGIPKHPDTRFIPPEVTPESLSEEAHSDVERGLTQMEDQILASDNERWVLRYMILGAATLSLQLGAIAEQDESARKGLIKGYKDGMDFLLREAVAGSAVKWIVLRDYAHWRFDDAVTDDWFHQYMDVARPYIREKVRLAKEYVLSADTGAARFAAIYDTLLAELRDKTLKTRPKRRFVRADLP